jgi:hypothetical protein
LARWNCQETIQEVECRVWKNQTRDGLPDAKIYSRHQQGKSSSHFLKPLFTFLRVRAKSGLSHMMMVYTQATLLKPLFPLLCVDFRKGAQYILGTAPTFPP